jgi:co-chaperonin GroES (HSP10)
MSARSSGDLRLLPGRVLIRRAKVMTSGLLHLPRDLNDASVDRDPKSVTLGTVVAMGPPVHQPKRGERVAVVAGFSVGDDVYFNGPYKAWTLPDDLCVVSLRDVIAVVEDDG